MSPIPTTIGPYRIERELARGGMGIVYLAHDTRLNRAAAIKALPDDVVADRDRLARFKQEAQVLASLSHPNIAAIYGLEEGGGRRYLALEYVEGETLAERIARGPLPINETVDICLQIAAGIEAAHEGGIIHRDLKPGNVMITPGDVVKVLDFGLAKVRVATDAGLVSESSPTLTDSPTTMPGVILGTAAYLSPEQARGKAVDRRTDIWSFGCVLYECLTGRRAFEGESVSDLIARILSSDPDWSRLPKSTPAGIRALLERSLEKDPRERLRDMGDARLALGDIREGKGFGAEPAPSPLAFSPRAIAIALLLTVATAASAGIALWNRIGPGREVALAAHQVRRASIEIPAEIQVTRWGMTPDGRFVFVRGRPRPKKGEEPAPFRAYRRRMDRFEFEEVKGSENTFTIISSPDGRWLYLLRPIREASADLQLVKVLTEGSAAPVTVSNWDASWVQWFAVLGNGDVVVTTQSGTAYVRIPASGAAPSAPIKIECPDSATFGFAEALPGDRGVLLYTVSYEGGEFHRGAGVLDLRSGKAKVLVRDGATVWYSRTGHLLFSRGSTVLAVPFDLKALEVRGEPVVVADSILSNGSEARYFISRDGTLLYQTGGVIGEHRRVVAADGQGRVNAWTPGEGHDDSPSVSPDGNRVACMILNPKWIDEIWVYERAGGPSRRVVAMEGADCWSPVWSPDGRKIAYVRRGHDRDDGLYVQSLDGGAPRKICDWYPGATGSFFPTSWSQDGRFLLASVLAESGGPVMGYGQSSGDVVRIEVSPRGDSLGAPTPLLSGPAYQGGARFSPDGGWAAYVSNEAGNNEVYVAPWREDGSLGRPLSLGRGDSPRWSRTGRDVFFQRSRWVMSVSLRYQATLSATAPAQRWELDSLRISPRLGWDILPGPQILFVQKEEGEESFEEATRFACVFSFFEEMKQKLRVAKKG